jgi:hypothetical protein
MFGIVKMKFTTRTIILWLLLGPVLAFLVSLPSWHVLHYFSPDKLAGLTEMINAYPMGLLMSVMAPWGWLMYGGLIMMISKRQRLGLICTAIGATLLGVFWPVWSAFLVST